MIRVAFQGEKGAFSEIAAKKFFNTNIVALPSFSFDEVFKKVKSNSANFGIIPVENSLYGVVFETYDLLLKYQLKIFAEVNLKINHQLISTKKIPLENIKKIYSHPQALGQCSEFLSLLENAEISPAYDTAGSVLILMKQSDEPFACIASREAAKIYNMKILKSNIQNNKLNITRFLIISKNTKTSLELSKPKSSICFELKSIPGALFKALSVFALRDIDLIKIESRPIPNKPFQYMFYIDLDGDLKETKKKNEKNH